MYQCARAAIRWRNSRSMRWHEATDRPIACESVAKRQYSPSSMRGSIECRARRRRRGITWPGRCSSFSTVAASRGRPRRASEAVNFLSLLSPQKHGSKPITDVHPGGHRGLLTGPGRSTDTLRVRRRSAKPAEPHHNTANGGAEAALSSRARSSRLAEEWLPELGSNQRPTD